LNEIVEQLNQELTFRNDIFPERDVGNDDRLKNLLEEFVQKLDSFEGKLNVSGTVSTLENDLSIVDNAVFLCGYMKCGTTMLLELMDGHPELIVIPGDSWFVDWVSDKTVPDKESLDSAWNHWIKRMINPTGQDPFWLLGNDPRQYREFKLYLDYWYLQFPASWSSMLVSVVLSYHCSISHSGAVPRSWVEKTPGNEFKVEKALRHFPNAKFIHIVRDPRENMASLKKLYATRCWSWDARGVAGTLAESCRLADINAKKYGAERYHVLRYEDLTKDPDALLKGMIDFLDISWDDCLLKPTINSMVAQSNTMYIDRQVKGVIRSASGGKWRNVLTGAEQRMILCTQRDAARVGYIWKPVMFDVCLNWLSRWSGFVWRTGRKIFPPIN
jgi:hypothetical protein